LTEIIITVISVIAGSLMCFEGYKIFRLSLGIAGGVAGFAVGKLIIEITSNTGISWSDNGRLIMLAVFAAGCGILAFTLYMKALITITTIICAFWFYDDFGFLFAGIANTGLRTVITYICGLVAGAVIGVIVYYAQKWTICLLTAFVGAKIISGVLSPLLWSAVFSGKYAGIIEHHIIGNDVGMSSGLVRIILLAAFLAAGFVLQLKTSKK